MMNEKGFTALAEKYMNMVYRIALNGTGSVRDAEDVTQNVMLRLYRSGPDFESEEHAKYWLIRVAVNESKRMTGLSWRRRETGYEEALNAFPAEDRLHRNLLHQVMELPPKYRVPLYLYYFEGYRVKEISAILGRSQSTIQTQLARGREKLRAVLQEELK